MHGVVRRFAVAMAMATLIFGIAAGVRADVFKRTMLADYNRDRPQRLFEHQALDCRLRALLPAEDYATLRSHMQVMSVNNARDRNGAYAFWGGVRGRFRFEEGLVLVHPDGRLWVGLLAGRKFKYYTNVNADFRRLPGAMRAWRKEIDNPKVYFASSAARAKNARSACRPT